MRNKRPSRNADVLVAKKHFEHPKIVGKLVLQAFGDEVVPHCKQHGIKMIIVDNESKFHSKI